MKIVGPNRTGTVQSLGRHSVGNTGFEGKAVLARAIGDTVGGLLQQTSQLMTDRQLQEAGLSAQEAQTAFNKEMSKDIFLNVNDPRLEGIVTDSMKARPNGRVMRAEVEAPLYERHMKESLKNISKTIDLPGPRADWEGRMKENGLRHLEGLQNKAQAEMKSQFFESQKSDWKKFADRGDWKEALEIADNMYGTESEREAYQYKAKRGLEENNYEVVERHGTDEQIQGAIEFLKQDTKDYRGKNGQLTEEGRNGWISSFQKELKRRDELANNVDKFTKERARYEIETMKGIIASGKPVPIRELNSLHASIVILNERTEGEFTKELLELEDARTLAESNNEKSLMSASERAAKTNDFVAEDARGMKIKNNMEAYDRAKENMENDDFAQSIIDSRLYKDGLIHLDLTDPNFGDNLSLRFGQVFMAEGTFGVGLAESGPLTNSEADRMSKEFNSMTESEQLRMMQIIKSSVGDDADLLYQQLAIKGQSKTFSIAGMMPDHTYEDKRTMLKGMRHAKANPDEVKDMKTGSEISFISSNSSMYIEHPKHREALKDAAINHYIGTMVERNGSLTGFDSSVYQESFDAVSGGSFEYNGTQFPNPEHGMPDGSMSDWIKRTSYRYIEDNPPQSPMGQAYSPKEFWDDFKAGGKFELRLLDDSKEFAVYAEVGGRLVSLRDKDGSVWTLVYDKTAPLTKDDPRKEVDRSKAHPLQRRGSLNKDFKSSTNKSHALQRGVMR